MLYFRWFQNFSNLHETCVTVKKTAGICIKSNLIKLKLQEKNVAVKLSDTLVKATLATNTETWR